MRSLWAKTGLTSDQSSYRILQDQDDKRIPIAIGVWTATAYKASIKLKRCSDKKFKRNLAPKFCINLFRFMGILFPGFWTIRLDRDCTQFSNGSKCYSKITRKRWQVPPIKAHFRILWSWLLYPREEPDPWSPYSTTDPDPTGCDPRSRRCDPWSHIPRYDPGLRA